MENCIKIASKHYWNSIKIVLHNAFSNSQWVAPYLGFNKCHCYFFALSPFRASSSCRLHWHWYCLYYSLFHILFSSTTFLCVAFMKMRKQCQACMEHKAFHDVHAHTVRMRNMELALLKLAWKSICQSAGTLLSTIKVNLPRPLFKVSSLPRTSSASAEEEGEAGRGAGAGSAAICYQF